MKEWSNLPNAKHIDWVLQSIKDNPDEWAALYNAEWNAERDAEKYEAFRAARNAVKDAVYNTAYDATWYAIRDSAKNEVWEAASDAVMVTVADAARSAILALIVYDDIEHYFLSSHEELRLIAELSQHPAAILLLPAVKVRELINEKTNVL